MAVELATAYISLIPSMKGAKGAIAADLAGVDSRGIGSEMGSKMGGGLAGSLKGIAGPAIAALGAIGFAGFIKDAATASDATDKFKATMSFAGMDTSAITAASKAAKDYADQTVYDLPTIQNMTAQLASNGVKDYTGLTQAAGNLNAVAGGSAETFKSVAMVMTQTAGAGKLTTENWNQLSDAIPGAAGPLMRSLEEAGAYTGNFRDAMAAGQITSDEFNASLMKLGMDPIAVEAARSTKTFEGAIGGLQATINSGLMGALNAMKPAITGAINLLSGGLGKAFEWTGKAATGLYDLFAKGDFTTAFREAFHVEEDSGLVNVMFNIRDTAIVVAGGFRAMFAAYKAGDGDVTSSGFAGVMERIGNGAREVTGGVRAFFAAFKAGGDDITSSGFPGFLEGLGLKARTLFDAISPAMAPLVAAFGALIPQVMGLWSAFSPLQIILHAVMPLLPELLGVFGQLAGVIGSTLTTALTTLVPLFVQLSGVVSQALGGVLAAVLPMVVQMITMLGQTLSQLLPIIMPIIATIIQLAMTLMAQLMPIVMQLVATVLPMVVTIFGAILQAIGPVIQMVAGLLIPIIMALMPVVVTVFGVIADVINSAMTIVMGIIQVVTGIISGNWAQVWSGMLNILSGVFGLIINLISGAIQLVISIIGAGLGVVVAVFFSVWSGIVGYLSTAFQSIVNGASGMLSDLVRFFGSIGGTVLGALGNIGGTLFSAGQSLIQGFIDGIKGMVGAIGDAVGGVLDFAKQFFPHSPAKRGPFSGSGYTSFSGKAMAGDFAKGILSERGSVEDAAASLMASASLTGSYQFAGSMSAATATTVAPPIYVQNPFTGEYLLAQVDGRVSSGMDGAATMARGRR